MTAEQLRHIADEKNNVWAEYHEVIKLCEEAARKGQYGIDYSIAGVRDCGFKNPDVRKQLEQGGFKVKYTGRAGDVNHYRISFSE